MATELEISAAKYTSPDVLQAQPGLSNNFQMSAELDVAPTPHPEIKPEIGVNFEAFDNAGMLATQDMRPEPGTEASAGLFSAVCSLAEDVRGHVDGANNTLNMGAPAPNQTLDVPPPAPVEPSWVKM